MKFGIGWAMEQMQEGKRVRLPYWRKGLSIKLEPAPGEPLSNLLGAQIVDTNTMKRFDFGPDILAEDWEIADGRGETEKRSD